MFKVLIVEDEWVVRRGLRDSFPWEEAGCIVIGEAEDGLSALEFIENNKPHIVFTDIRMPEMDGLSLADEINRRYPDIQIIIHTGFDDFAYAQNAVRVGVKDFLLKPTNPDEIMKSLRRITAHLKEHLLTKEATEKNQQQIDLGKQLLIEKIVYDNMLQYRVEVENELFSELRIKLLANKFRIAYIHIDTQTCNPETINNVYHKIIPLLPFSSDISPIRFGDNQFAFLISGEREQGEREIVKLLQCLADYGLKDYMFGVSHCYDDLYHISDAYREAKQALYYTIIPESLNIAWLEDYSNEPLFDSQIISLEQLIETIKWGTQESVIHEVHMWYTNLVYKCQSEEVEIRRKFIEVVVSTYSLIMKYSEVEVRTDAMELQEYFNNNQSIELWLNRYINFLLEWKQQFIIVNGGNQKKEFEKVKEYIQTFYMKPISLQQLARRYNMSEGHFSRLFKKEVGSSYIDYVTSIRIEKSKEYLANSRFKIYEVALNVGYEDARYYSQLFKKYTGEKPTDFRKRLGIYVDSI